MLAHLDYTRDAPPDARASLYESYAGAFAGDSQLREQFLLRLRQETAALPAAAMIHVLRAVSTLPPSETFTAIVTDVWHRLEPHGGEEPLAELIRDIQFRWPEDAVGALGELAGLATRRAR
jgi:hypothetical protein